MPIIDKDSNQSEFRDEYHKLIWNLFNTMTWLEDQMRKATKPFGITVQQYNVLRVLRGKHPNAASINLLTLRMIDKNSNASRLVEKLRLKGLVERQLNHSDRRAVDVVITEKGLDLLKKIDPLQDLWYGPLKRLSSAEANSICELLDRMRGYES